jgi:hypothetical protein
MMLEHGERRENARECGEGPRAWLVAVYPVERSARADALI